jgi:DNA-binding NarL/FixJ family response regulator
VPDVRRIRVLLADDHAVVREGVKRVLERELDIEVAGDAIDAASAVSGTLSLQPDVLVLDLSMPGGSGLEVLRTLASRGSGTRVIIFSATTDRTSMAAALELGARGIIDKAAAGTDLVAAIHAVACGDFWLAGRVSNAADVLRRLNQAPPRDKFNLTDRQREIIAAVAEGLNNREIAERLRISEHTVKHHVTQAFNKTGASTRLELALFATEHRLLNP